MVERRKLMDLYEVRSILSYPKFVPELSSVRVRRLVELGVVRVYDYGPTLVGGIRVLGKGHSSVVVLAKHEKLGDVALKIRRVDSKKNSLAKEGYLMSLDKFNVVPKVHHFDDDLIIMEYLEGSTLGNFLRGTRSHDDLLKVFANTLHAAHLLDLDLIDHLELANPYKHVFVLEDLNVKFLDFESARISAKPCNLCRIMSFLVNFLNLRDGERFRELLKKYKKGCKEAYRELLTGLVSSGVRSCNVST